MLVFSLLMIRHSDDFLAAPHAKYFRLCPMAADVDSPRPVTLSAQHEHRVRKRVAQNVSQDDRSDGRIVTS
jgi:hypothetical protein